MHGFIYFFPISIYVFIMIILLSVTFENNLFYYLTSLEA